MDEEAALKDFENRVKMYEDVYEPIEDSEDNGQISYIKLIDVGAKVESKYYCLFWVSTAYLQAQLFI